MLQTTERERLQEELEEAKDKARRRSIGNIKFIGELFKLKMLTEAIMHDCVVKLLKNHDEESLECLCRLLTTIGKDLDFEKAKVRLEDTGDVHLSETLSYDGFSCCWAHLKLSKELCEGSLCSADLVDGEHLLCVLNETSLVSSRFSLGWISILTRWRKL